MALAAQVALAILGPTGRRVGELRVRTLPQSPSGLWDLRGDPNRDEALEPVQIMEGHEYGYELELEGRSTSDVVTDHPEVLLADRIDGRSDRKSVV